MKLPLLALKDLHLTGHGKPILSGLNLELDRGRWVALVGPNGSGKTTLLRSLAGRHEPARGSVELEGRSLYSGKTAACPLPGFAVPPEDLPPFLTTRQCLEIYANSHGLAAPPSESIALFGLLGLNSHAHTLVRQSSFGTQQKLAVVLGLMMPTPLLLLDEVFNGLDFSSALKLRVHLREHVDREGMTILLATHSLDIVLQCCDEIFLLDDGRLVKRWEMNDFSGADGLSRLENALASA